MITHNIIYLSLMRRLRYTIIHLLLVALCAATLHAQTASAQSNEPSAARLRGIVTYLASDQLEGRRTGTPGAEAAAQYIADEFKRLGLRPGVSIDVRLADGRNQRQAQAAIYNQSFPYIAGVSLGKTNAMAFTPKTEIGVGVVP